MRLPQFAIVLITCLFCVQVYGQEQVKVMFYNLLNYPNETAVPGRDADLQVILNDAKPDLFLVCELNTEAGANTILGYTRTLISPSFERATFVFNTSDDLSGDSNELQNMLFYDSDKFSITEETIVQTDLRDFNVYKLLVNTVDQVTNPVEVYIVVAHLKASQGDFNVQRRFEMVQELDAYLSTLPATTNVILGGDLNIYTGTESAFQELLDSTNNITFADPVNRIGNWTDDSSFFDVFTQSTRTQSGLGGASGGLDDRFDFILVSENIQGPSNNLRYVTDSYETYGNNEVSSCYNNRINSSNCAGAEYSFAIRDALHNFSDHLPVILKLEFDSNLLSTTDESLASTLLLKKTIVSSELEISIANTDLYNQKLMIYNQLGQNVASFRLGQNSEQRFDVSQLSNGLYFLAVDKGSNNPIKFIVAN